MKLKNKKASVGNQIFSFAILVFALFVLITAFVRLTIKYNIKDSEGNTRVIGDTQMKLIETYAKGESILFYLDKAALYSLKQSYSSLAKNGGLQTSECGKYQDYYLWNNEDKECYPEDYKTNFENLFRNYFRIYLIQYPLFDLSQNAYENNYNFAFNYEDGIEIIGNPKNTLEIQLTKEGYDFNQNYEELDIGFDKPEEKEYEPQEAPLITNLGSGTCSGNLVSISGTCSGGCALRASVVEQLRKAEQIATKSGLKLAVNSAYRSAQHQEQLWNKYSRNCGRVCCPADANAIPLDFSRCPHVNGCAVDIALAGKNMKDATNQKKLEQIMCEAGFVRYSAEYWHFEYGTPRWQKGTAQGVCAI